MILKLFPVFGVHFTVHPHAADGVAAVAAQRAPEVTRRLMHFEVVSHLRLGDADKVAEDAAQQRTVNHVIWKRRRMTSVDF